MTEEILKFPWLPYLMSLPTLRVCRVSADVFFSPAVCNLTHPVTTCQSVGRNDGGTKLGK